MGRFIFISRNLLWGVCNIIFSKYDTNDIFDVLFENVLDNLIYDVLLRLNEHKDKLW